MSVITRFRKLTHEELILFIEALFQEISAGLVLKVIPFRRIPRLFSSRQFETPTKEEAQSRTLSIGTTVGSQQSVVIERVKVAVQRAGKVSPWRNRCLVSSLAARRMLNRRRISSQVSLGLAKNTGGRLIAHAWIRAGEVEIVEKRGDYVEIYQF